MNVLLLGVHANTQFAPLLLAAANRTEETAINVFMLAVISAATLYFWRRRRPPSSAYGRASFASDGLLKRFGMLGKQGLILGRTLSGKLIRVPRYNSCLLIGGIGAGKGIGFIIPNLLTYFSGSLFCHDTKGDLFATVGSYRRRMGQRVILLAPFLKGTDRINPLAHIRAGPTLISEIRAVAESLTSSDEGGGSHDPYWQAKAAQVLTAILYYIVLRSAPDERHLGSAQDIASDIVLLHGTANNLRDMGGLARRMGGQILTLFLNDGRLTKEGASVVSSLTKSLSWLDDELVSHFISGSTFDVHEALSPGSPAATFFHIEPGQLAAQRGLLRCVVATLVRAAAKGSETKGETLFLLDESSALSNLAPLEEALVRGRSSGVRCIFVYQSDSQVRAAFANKPTLVYDNTDLQIYLGANSFETAERLSKMLGSYTQTIENHSENTGISQGQAPSSGNQSQGRGTNTSLAERALMRPEEILTMSRDFLLAFCNGLPAPILARRIKWYADSAFNPKARNERRKWRPSDIALALLAIALIVLTVRAKVTHTGYWQPEPKGGVQWQDQKAKTEKNPKSRR